MFLLCTGMSKHYNVVISKKRETDIYKILFVLREKMSKPKYLSDDYASDMHSQLSQSQNKVHLP